MKLKKLLAWLAGIATIVIILLCACWAWLSFGPMNSLKQKVFSVLPFPAAVVADRPISLKSYITRYQLAQTFSRNSGQQQPDDLKTLVFNRMIAETEIEALAKQHGVTATGPEIDQEFRWQQSQLQAQGQNLTQELAQYGINQQTYKTELVKTNVMAANLTTWFYSQRNLNPEAYATADQILSQFQAGAKFEDLAKTFSQDEQSKALGGDVGFVELDQILPEVQNTLKDTSLGQAQLAATRYGLEIIEVMSPDGNGANGATRLHLRQIFLAGQDFKTWYDQETKNFKILKLIKL